MRYFHVTPWPFQWVQTPYSHVASNVRYVTHLGVLTHLSLPLRTNSVRNHPKAADLCLKLTVSRILRSSSTTFIKPVSLVRNVPHLAQFHPMKRTVSSYETHSFIPWNSQFHPMKLTVSSHDLFLETIYALNIRRLEESSKIHRLLLCGTQETSSNLPYVSSQ